MVEKKNYDTLALVLGLISLLFNPFLLASSICIGLSNGAKSGRAKVGKVFGIIGYILRLLLLPFLLSFFNKAARLEQGEGGIDFFLAYMISIIVGIVLSIINIKILSNRQDVSGNYNYDYNVDSYHEIVCPVCGNNTCSVINESTTEGKDFSVGKSCIGYICLGPIGLLCGSCGGGKRVINTNYWVCNRCGNKWKM